MPSRRTLELLLNDREDSRSKIDGLTDDVLGSILHRSVLESFGDMLGEDGIAAMVSALHGLDSGLSSSGDLGGRELISRQLFGQLGPLLRDSPGFDEFDSRLSAFLRTLERRIEFARTPKLVELPRREFGKPGFGELSSLGAPDELAGYMIGLARGFHRHGDLTARETEYLIGLIEKISSAPGYLRFLNREKKQQEILRLSGIIRRLASSGTLSSLATSDLLASLGILLFNLGPSEKVVRFLSSTRPSSTSSALLYHYYAILALHHMQAGSLDTASIHAASALNVAEDPEKKAYMQVLQGCIWIASGDYHRALAALKDASAQPVQDHLKGLISFYTGMVYFEMGEYANAIPSFEAAGRYASDALDQVTVHNNIGSCALKIGDDARAAQEFRAIEQISRSLKGTQANQCTLLVSSYPGAIWDQGGDQLGKAITCYQKALKAASGRGDLHTVTNLLGNLGIAYARTGDHGQALQALKACLACAESIGYWDGIRFAYWHICHTLREVDKAEAKRFREDYASKYPELRDL